MRGPVGGAISIHTATSWFGFCMGENVFSLIRYSQTLFVRVILTKSGTSEQTKTAAATTANRNRQADIQHNEWMNQSVFCTGNDLWQTPESGLEHVLVLPELLNNVRLPKVLVAYFVARECASLLFFKLNQISLYSSQFTMHKNKNIKHFFDTSGQRKKKKRKKERERKKRSCI